MPKKTKKTKKSKKGFQTCEECESPKVCTAVKECLKQSAEDRIGGKADAVKTRPKTRPKPGMRTGKQPNY